MKRAHKFFLFSACIYCQYAVSAGDISDPVGLKGMMLGSNYADARDSDIYMCKEHPGALSGDKSCELVYMLEKKLANAPIEEMKLFYYGDTLHVITVLFRSENYQQIFSAFNEKFGPGKISEEKLTTRMGVEVDGTSSMWLSPTASILLIQYSGTINQSQIVVSTKYSKNEYSARSRQKTKENAADL